MRYTTTDLNCWFNFSSKCGSRHCWCWLRCVTLLLLLSASRSTRPAVICSYDHAGQVQLYGSAWKIATYVSLSNYKPHKIELWTVNLIWKEWWRDLSPEAISTCQSDLMRNKEIASKMHRTHFIISHVLTRNKVDDTSRLDSTYT